MDGGGTREAVDNERDDRTQLLAAGHVVERLRAPSEVAVSFPTLERKHVISQDSKLRLYPFRT